MKDTLAHSSSDRKHFFSGLSFRLIFAAALAASAAAVLAWPTTVQAAVCGAGTAKPQCECGDYVEGNFTFTQDLGPCNGAEGGLRVSAATGLFCNGGSGVCTSYNQSCGPGGAFCDYTPLTIDCNGFRLFKNSNAFDRAGIDNHYKADGGLCSDTQCRPRVTVKNCTIEGFKTGISFSGWGWNITGNTIMGRFSGGTVYPVTVGIGGGEWGGGSTNIHGFISIIDNTILEATERGIYLSKPGPNSEIRGNHVTTSVLNQGSLLCSGSGNCTGLQADDFCSGGTGVCYWAVQAEAGIELYEPQGAPADRIRVRGNFIDCSTRADLGFGTQCDWADLYVRTDYPDCPNPDDATKWGGRMDVYDNLFSGRGVYISCTAKTSAEGGYTPDINFRPPLQAANGVCEGGTANGFCDDVDCPDGPANPDRADCEARWNVFSNALPFDVRDGSCTASGVANGLCDPDCKMTGGVQYDPDCRGLPQPYFYYADEYLKACEAAPTTATRLLSENVCFIKNTAATFTPAAPATTRSAIAFAQHSSNYGLANTDVGVALDCNWDSAADSNGKLQLNGSVPLANAVNIAGIAANATRLPNAKYTPRKRGAIIGCELENFGTGIQLENSQDFLLRWNTVRTVRDIKQGFFYRFKSDHVQDCFPDDGDGILCEPVEDGDGAGDPDPEYPAAVNVLDYRHHIYNPSFRPTANGVNKVIPFNWIGTTLKQVLYFFGGTHDGLVVNGNNVDPYFFNVGHLTAANVQTLTIQNYGGLVPGPGTAIASGDGISLACVGMQRTSDNRCNVPVVDTAEPYDTPSVLVDNVAVTGSYYGFYLINSYRVAIEDSRSGGTGAGNQYGVLMFGTASTTVGCDPVPHNNDCEPPAGGAAGCNCLLSNDEGIWAQSWGLASSKVLVWGNTIADSKKDGAMLWETNACTVLGNTISNTGACVDGGGNFTCLPDAVGLYLYGASDCTVYNNLITQSDGDNVAIVRSDDGSPSNAVRNFVYGNVISASLNGRGVYTYNLDTSVEGNSFGWAREDGTVCPTSAPYQNPACPDPLLHPGAATDVWPQVFGPLCSGYTNCVTGNAKAGVQIVGSNNDTLYRNKIEGNADGLILNMTKRANAVQNLLNGNSGWGFRGWDHGQNQLVRNIVTVNGRGGMNFSNYIYTLIDFSPVRQTVAGNVITGNTGPGLLFFFAQFYDVVGNTVRFPTTTKVPGVLVFNSNDLYLRGNVIAPESGTPTQLPYLTTAWLPHTTQPPYNFSGGGAGLIYFDHRIYQSNAAGTATDIKQVTYELQDGANPVPTGYSGTSDVNLRQQSPAANQNGVDLTVAGDEPGGTTNDSRVLLKWNFLTCSDGTGSCVDLMPGDICSDGNGTCTSILPGSCDVTEATITVYVWDSTVDRFAIYEVKRPWDETTATWNTTNGTTAWQTAGADGVIDRGQTNLAAAGGFGSGSSPAPYPHTLNDNGRQLVEDWVRGVKPNHGFIIMPDSQPGGDADLFRFDRREPVINIKPKLTVKCDLYPPVYYFAQNREFRGDNSTVDLPIGNRTIEKACLGTSYNYGQRCTTFTDCIPNNIADSCKPLLTKHVQIARSDDFTVQNFTGALGSRVLSGDPLQADFVTETSLLGLELGECLGPCLTLQNSRGADVYGPAAFTLDNVVVSNPFGHGLVVQASTYATATDVRVVPGAASIEGDAVHVDDVESMGLRCQDCNTVQLWNGLTGGGDALTSLPGTSPLLRNELDGANPANNQFWEFQASGGTLVAITRTKFTDRGAFLVSCQPGRDGCCNAADDTPNRCDPDCGTKSGGVPVDRDCAECLSTAGNCCLALVDGQCDADCPAAVDPDCWMRGNGLKDGSCTTGSGDGCDYDCPDSDPNTPDVDPDCKPRTCSPSKDDCCNPSNDSPDVCDPDCTYQTLGAGADIVDPDCGLGSGVNDGCWPGTGTCDIDCPAGVDPACGVDSVTGRSCAAGATCQLNSTYGLDVADDRCNAQNDNICDPDCLGGGVFSSTDLDCSANFCTFRPSFTTGPIFAYDGNSVCDSATTPGVCDDDCNGVPNPDPDCLQVARDGNIICDSDSNGVCDDDCTGTPNSDPDCARIDCCMPAVDGACDDDCPFGVDADCTTPSQWPLISGCQGWRDGQCDYSCTAGTDPDCPAPLANQDDPPGAEVCLPWEDGVCDTDCPTDVNDPNYDDDCGLCGRLAITDVTTTNIPMADGRCDAECTYSSQFGISKDPDCNTCTSSRDGCCLAIHETSPSRCDPDCGPGVDPDCGTCLQTSGNCCLPEEDDSDPGQGCDLDCPAGFDPDCTADGYLCGDRSFEQSNAWPATISIPYSDDRNYPYERGVPNEADSCIAPVVRFTADAAGNAIAAKRAQQYRPPRSYTLEQRRWSRGDFSVDIQAGDFEGTGLHLGVMFATEAVLWHDPIDKNSSPPGGGWYCGSGAAQRAYWCSSSFYNAEAEASQPTGAADDPLPLPRAAYPTSPPGPPPPPAYPTGPHPSVDNSYKPNDRGPSAARLGEPDNILTRTWLNADTMTPVWNPDYLTTVSLYWATALSKYHGTGVKEPLDGRRQALWLELVTPDSASCTETVNSGCFSAGNSYPNLCTAASCPGGVCSLNCALDSTKGWLDDWTKRQRVVVDLKPTDADVGDDDADAIGTMAFDPQNPLGPAPYRYLISWPRYSSSTDLATGIETMGGEVRSYSATIAGSADYASWTPGQAHYEIWYGTNKEEIQKAPLGKLLCVGGTGSCEGLQIGAACGTGTCQANDGNATNGPYVWEDMPGGGGVNSGLPHESCTWDSIPLGNLDGDCYDSNLARITCKKTDPDCRTVLKTAFATGVYFLICAVDDFGNYEGSCIFSESTPWVQVKYGDLFAGSNFDAANTSVLPNATFLITSAGTINNWNTGCSSEADFGWGPCRLPGYTKLFPTYKNDFTTPAGSIWFLRGYTGANFGTATPSTGTVLDALRARYGVNRVVDISAPLSNSACTWWDDSVNPPPSGWGGRLLGGKVYWSSGNCIIDGGATIKLDNGTLDQDGSGLFLINGNLTINENIEYSDLPALTDTSRLKNMASATWLVLGGVFIGVDVTRVDANIIALGSSAYRNTACDTTDFVACGTVQTGAVDESLTIKGILAAREFKFERTGSALYTASETVIYDGRILANPPPGLDDLLQSLPVWKQ